MEQISGSRGIFIFLKYHYNNGHADASIDGIENEHYNNGRADVTMSIIWKWALQ